MPVEWTPHRFSGGALALDVANTVVRRDRPEKRFDRFAEAFEIGRFAAAASVERAVEFGGRALDVADCEAARPAVIAIRETTDALFRDAAATGELRPALLGSFLRAAAVGIEAEAPSVPTGKISYTAPPLRFEAALARSALSLLPPDTHRRIRICPNCAWLFLDRSRNRSRTWCDMAVCGNREKARRHYRSKREKEPLHA